MTIFAIALMWQRYFALTRRYAPTLCPPETMGNGGAATGTHAAHDSLYKAAALHCDHAQERPRPLPLKKLKGTLNAPHEDVSVPPDVSGCASSSRLVTWLYLTG